MASAVSRSRILAERSGLLTSMDELNDMASMEVRNSVVEQAFNREFKMVDLKQADEEAKR